MCKTVISSIRSNTNKPRRTDTDLKVQREERVPGDEAVAAGRCNQALPEGAVAGREAANRHEHRLQSGIQLLWVPKSPFSAWQARLCAAGMWTAVCPMTSRLTFLVQAAAACAGSRPRSSTHHTSAGWPPPASASRQGSATRCAPTCTILLLSPCPTSVSPPGLVRRSCNKADLVHWLTYLEHEDEGAPIMCPTLPLNHHAVQCAPAGAALELSWRHLTAGEHAGKATRGITQQVSACYTPPCRSSHHTGTPDGCSTHAGMHPLHNAHC